MFGKKVWGLDLGRSAVKGVLLTSCRQGVKILDADIVPVEGAPPDGSLPAIRGPRLLAALRTFQEKHRLYGARVCVSVPSHNALVRDLTVASVGRKRMNEMVRFEASNEIPFVLDEVMWDYTLFKEDPAEPTRKGFLLAVKKNIMEAYMRVFEDLEISHVDLITITPLALLNFLRLEMGPEDRALALDIGARNSNLIALDERRFWMRSIASGGDQITAILQKEFNLDFEAAEKAKANLLRSEYARRIVKALRPAMDDVVRNVKTNLTYLEGNEGLVEIHAAYAVGGGSRLPGLKKLLTRNLRLDVRNINKLEHLVVSPLADADFVRLNLDRLLVAVGAGIAGLRRDPDDISFLPKSYERAATVSRARGAVLAVGLLLWLILGTLYGFGRIVQGKVALVSDSFQNLKQLHDGNQRARSGSELQRRALTEEINFALAIGADKNHIVELLDALVTAFDRSSANFRLRIDSFECAEKAAKKGPGVLVGTVSGTIAPKGASTANPYDCIALELVPGLRTAFLPPILAAKARFSEGSSKVLVAGVNLPDYVKPGDAIKPLAPEGQQEPPGWEWYIIQKVSGAELTLTRDFAGADTEAECVISRVVLEQYLVPEGATIAEFTISFEVPGRKPESLESLGVVAARKP